MARSRVLWPAHTALGRYAVAAACVALALCTAGCGQLAWYRQSVAGQLDIASRRQAIDALIADDSSDARLRRQLEQVREIREYAVRRLGLPDTGSYTQYADLGRDYAVYALYAAPEFSTALKTWCYPVAGCASYRGYFDSDMLQADADTLRAKGYEVYIAAVPAYSTLGWFDDPLLNTVIDWPREQLAGLVFHELAHQQLYLKGDTVFNESFATAVEHAGVERWLSDNGETDALARYRDDYQRRDQVVQLLAGTRQRLQSLYDQALPAAVTRAAKQRYLDEARQAYRALRAGWDSDPGFDQWFNGRLNNAQLGSVAAYNSYVDGFLQILAGKQGDFQAFYAEAARIAALTPDERRPYLVQRVAGNQVQ
jgi:predicted aminopeptidase